MATASNQQRTPREVIDFAPNVPVTLALKYAQGKIVSGKNGERVMFTTTDDRVCFLDPAVAGQIETAGINVRENFTLTQHWDGGKNSPRVWEVKRTTGEQPNGTLVVPALPEAKPVQRAERSTQTAQELLVIEANNLVDAYAEVLNRALVKHEGRVKPDEVRSILLSAYIQRRQLSSVA